MGSIEMSKSLKEILSTPIKDTTVSEIRLQVVVGLPLPLIFINKLFFVHLPRNSLRKIVFCILENCLLCV